MVSFPRTNSLSASVLARGSSFALAALMLCVAPSLAAAQKSSDRVPPVVDELTQTQVFVLLSTLPEDGELDREALRKQLLQLGADLGPIAAGILCGEIELPVTVHGTKDLPVSPELLRIRDELLRECVLDLDGRGLADHLAQRAGSNAPLQVRLCASRLLGDISDPSALDELIGIARGIDSASLAAPSVRGVLEHALALRMADVVRSSKLERYASSCSVELTALLVRAAARAGTPATRRFLISQMDRDEDIQKFVMREIAATRGMDAFSLNFSELSDLRSNLYSFDGEVRRLAALALGRLEDLDSVPALIELLKAENSLEASAAHEALRSISRSDLGTQAAAWTRWYAGEELWWKQTAPAELTRFAGADGREQHQAFEALMRHPLYRHDLALAMVDQLRMGDPATSVMACRALERLGSQRAVPDLVEVLTDPDDEVRAAAEQALRSLAKSDPALVLLLDARNV